MDRKNLGPVLTNGQLSEVRTLIQQLKRSGSLLDLASPRVASLLRAIDLENDGTTVLVETPRIDETGDIAIPDEVVDLRLLLDCRHERNVLQKICAERSDELDRLSTRLEVREDGGPDGIECRDETIRMQEHAIDRLRAEVEALTAGLLSVQNLIDQSQGVYGLHLNGDPAPWDELLEGGRYEDWLVDFSTAMRGEGE